MMGTRGFTLLELLIVAAIVAMAAVVILGGFTAGVRVWERALEFSGEEAAARVAVATVRKDMCNMIPNRAASFQGEASWVELPAVVGDASNLWPGTIRYEFSRGTLKRIRRVMEGTGRSRESGEELFAGKCEGSFLYGDAGPDGQGAVVWTDHWAGFTNLPVAVKLVLRFPGGKPSHEMRKTVVLPRGYPVKAVKL